MIRTMWIGMMWMGCATPESRDEDAERTSNRPEGALATDLSSSSAAVDDTATSNDAGPGDTYATVDASGGSVADVNFGFSYNLVVNVNDSGQGSLRRFIENANEIAGANAMRFVPGVATNASGGGGSWWQVNSQRTYGVGESTKYLPLVQPPQIP